MGKRRKRFTEAFKREAVRQCELKGEPSRVARDLGIGRSTLFNWMKQYGASSEPVEAAEEDLGKEVARLRKRVQQLEMEKEILKKAAAFFAKESK